VEGEGLIEGAAVDLRQIGKALRNEGDGNRGRKKGLQTQSLHVDILYKRDRCQLFLAGKRRIHRREEKGEVRAFWVGVGV